MQLSSYRRFVLAGSTFAAAALLFAIPASASAQALTYSDGTLVGGNYYSNGQPVGGASSLTGWTNTNPNSSLTGWPSSSPDYSGYGSISQDTGRPRTEYVSGYVNSHGSYTNPYYRS